MTALESLPLRPSGYLPSQPPAGSARGTQARDAHKTFWGFSMFDKTLARIAETASDKSREATGPLLNALWTIAVMVGLVFVALVTRAR